MSLKNMKKEELELLSYKDITCLILDESKTSMNTADLFKRIIELLGLSNNIFESKIADYYTSLSTDKRFILLKDGTWDLRSRHTSDKLVKVTEEDDDEEVSDDKEEPEEVIEEDNYDDQDSDDYNEDTNEELKDLVIIDEDELELEQ